LSVIYATVSVVLMTRSRAFFYQLTIHQGLYSATGAARVVDGLSIIDQLKSNFDDLQWWYSSGKFSLVSLVVLLRYSHVQIYLEFKNYN